MAGISKIRFVFRTNDKEKFNPQWCAKFLACPGGKASPQVLADVATLIPADCLLLE